MYFFFPSFFSVISSMYNSLLSFQFLGNTEVEAPKGTEVVKDAVRKLKVKPVLGIKCMKLRRVFISDQIGQGTQSTGGVGVSGTCPPPSLLPIKVPLEFYSSQVRMPVTASLAQHLAMSIFPRYSSNSINEIFSCH